MSNSYNASIPAKVQTLLTNLTTSIGNSLSLNLSQSPGFVLVLELSPDGNTLTVREYSRDQGQSLHPAFTIDTSLLP